MFESEIGLAVFTIVITIFTGGWIVFGVRWLKKAVNKL